MKVIFTLGTIIFFVSLVSCAVEKRNPIEGAWQLVEGKNVSADSTEVYPASLSGKSMKIIGKTHFATVTQDTTSSSTGFNGGSYTFENDIYTEHLTYFSLVDAIGISASYKVKIEGDILFMVPSTADGEEQELGTFEEWKRLE